MLSLSWTLLGKDNFWGAFLAFPVRIGLPEKLLSPFLKRIALLKADKAPIPKYYMIEEGNAQHLAGLGQQAG